MESANIEDSKVVRLSRTGRWMCACLLLIGVIALLACRPIHGAEWRLARCCSEPPNRRLWRVELWGSPSCGACAWAAARG